MPEFKTFEEKAVYDQVRLDEKIDKLETDIAELKDQVEMYKKREELYKELLRLFRLRYRKCLSFEEAMIDVEKLYPVDAKYADAVKIIEELGIKVYEEDK